MEAFRLIPGLIVIEQSNGNYDIHIRGGSNVQRNAIFSVGGNTTSLVMIDNRPIYNYYLGGTFWETIPIDLNDVERIELVRGPTSAMYGPNALSGVINIITREPDDEGVYVNAQAFRGRYETSINNASIGYQFKKKLDFLLSAYWQQRNRNQDSYYAYFADSYIPSDSILQFAPDAYPNPEQAQKKYGVNAFINYQPTSKVDMRLSAGLQDSEVQKAYTENFVTPLTTSLSESYYVDFTAQFGDLSTQFSFQNGTQSEGLGAAGQKWDFTTYDAVAEYNIDIKNFNLKPGLNFREAIYDDTPFVDANSRSGQFNAREEILNFAAYLRGDFLTLRNKLRLIAAFRVDWFNFPDEAYISYQFAANYKLNENNIFRFLAARANRSANIIFTYANTLIPQFPLFTQDVTVEVSGNQELELLTRDLIELGYRTKIKANLQLDVEVFYSQTQNYADFLYGDTDVSTTPNVQSFQTFNIPLKTRQFGATFSLNYVINRLQIRPYLTYQSTTLLNSSTFNNTPSALFVPANDNPQTNNIDSNIGSSMAHTGTPEVFGG
ncbi:MAG: TonB-dependent receptor plug domain-containing protein, partial [Bacteroidota bacterium]